MKVLDGGSECYSHRKVYQSLSPGYKDPKKMLNLYNLEENIENDYERMGRIEDQIIQQ